MLDALCPRGSEVASARRVAERCAVFKKKIRMRLYLLGIPQSGEKNVNTFRWDHMLQIQNPPMAFC